MKKQIIFHQDNHIEYLFILSIKNKHFIKQIQTVYDVKNRKYVVGFLSNLEGRTIKLSHFEKSLAKWAKKHLKMNYKKVQTDYKPKTINATKDMKRLTKEIEDNYGGVYGNTNWITVKRTNKKKKEQEIQG